MSLTGRQAGRCRAIKAHPALPPILVVKAEELHSLLFLLEVQSELAHSVQG